MTIWLTHPNPIDIVRLLFWGSLLSSLSCFATDRYVCCLLKIHWKLILFCVAVVLLWRIPEDGAFFHGLEYEDSYIYTVAGREMAQHFPLESSATALPYSV